MPRAAAAWGGFAVAAKTQRTSVNRTMLSRLGTNGFPPEARQHAPEPLLALDFRLPAEQLPGPGDVGLTDLRVIDGKSFEHDFAFRRDELHKCLRELQNRKLLRVAEVHRQMLAALGEQMEPADQVVHVAEAAGLRAVAEDGDRLVLDRLTKEGRN